MATTPNFKLVSMPTDPVQKSLSATFQNQENASQSVNVHLSGATGDAKANIKAALEACLKGLEAI
ncbi:hypothetical protein E3C22_16700 [Jiella endophytica]|uniref:Uncharacterized protein n=1 Tax=Jiella endophytica TaxID=2558362 RepID=A0A4Y8RG07_9HYPH|nr:hypothetical protein [Jiella endophytica]TFF20547.1 hypothetical protein E3C22_16700 [Jiella endophytica]